MTDIRDNVFEKGVFAHLDDEARALAGEFMTLESIAREASGESAGGAGACKLDNNERDGWFLSTTKKRWDSMLAGMDASMRAKFSAKPISASSIGASHPKHGNLFGFRQHIAVATPHWSCCHGKVQGFPAGGVQMGTHPRLQL